MTETPEKTISSLWTAFELLQSRCEACEFLGAEVLGQQLAQLDDEDARARAGLALLAKLAPWPAVWEREPMEADELALRRAQLNHAVGRIIGRAVERAGAIAAASRARSGEKGS